jgi:hypothetical protein
MNNSTHPPRDGHQEAVRGRQHHHHHSSPPHARVPQEEGIGCCPALLFFSIFATSKEVDFFVPVVPNLRKGVLFDNLTMFSL